MKSLTTVKFRYKTDHRVTCNAFFILSLSSILIGCGGGGGGGSSTNQIKSYPAQPSQPIDLSAYVINPGTYRQQTVSNVNSPWGQNYKGNGITIGIIDSGINQNHIDFYNDSGNTRIDWQNARGIETSNGTDINITFNYTDIDDDYHGTHISSIAAGREFGIAPEATILPINVFFDNNSAYDSAIYTGIEYAASRSPVINASITEMVNFSTIGGTSSEFNQYLNLLNTYDTALITAAGNGGADNIGDPIGAEHFSNNNTAQNLSIEAQIDNQILHVIALATDGTIASFSNYPGSCSDVVASPDLACDTNVMSDIQNNFISAPGVSIEAAYGGNNTGSVSYNGTSMATPIVSGGIAVLLSGWDQLTAQQAINILKSTANNTGIYSNASLYGVGLIDLDAAMTPLGTLKSGTSVSLPASTHTLTNTGATFPSELKSLAKLGAFNTVAFFDDYNRDFLVNVSPQIQVEKQAIKWSDFFNLNHEIEQQITTDVFTVTTHFNAEQPLGMARLSLQTPNTLLQYNAQTSRNNPSFLLPETSRLFHSQNQFEYGSSFSTKHLINQHFSLFGSVQSPLLADSPEKIDHKNISQKHSHSLGIELYPNKNLRLSIAAQIDEQEQQLFNTQSSGALSVNENSLNQTQFVAVEYVRGSTQFFGTLSHSYMLENEAVDGSFIDIKNARFADLKLGLIHKQHNRLYGIQAFNTHNLMDADIRLNIPVDASAQSEVIYNQIDYKHKGSLAPDSLELFYQSKTNNNGLYQLNLLKSPDDLGLGLQFKSTF